jgi:hypothetical protein
VRLAQRGEEGVVLQPVGAVADKAVVGRLQGVALTGEAFPGAAESWLLEGLDGGPIDPVRRATAVAGEVGLVQEAVGGEAA